MFPAQVRALGVGLSYAGRSCYIWWLGGGATALSLKSIRMETGLYSGM